MMFSQLELLPIAYFTIVMWVVCATVLAKLFGFALVDATSGTLRRILSRPINIRVTGDGIVLHFFEARLVANLQTRLLFERARDFARLLGERLLAPVPTQAYVLQKILIPEQYWSGCPPNRI
ncbi:MAG TPA: hypothetical protein V6C52_01195 [Coleofasciculaceae cyanobacterium]|jgi:hypothetical protein